MNTKKLSTAFYDFAILVGLLFFAFGLVAFPRDTSASCTNGIYLCINAVFPSLFPFFVLSSLIIDSGIVEKFSNALSYLSKTLFGISGKGFSAFLLGIIGGYPVGAKTAVALYEKGLCSKKETERLLCFCNNSGPAFILGVVGVSIFGNLRLGFLLYLCHVLSSVILGIALKLIFGDVSSKGIAKANQPRLSFPQSFINAVTGGMSAMLSVCAFVIFFGVFITVLTKSGLLFAISQGFSAVFGTFLSDNGLLISLITGFFELTNGLISLQNADFYGAVTISALLLGWAGMSVHFQTMTFTSRAGLSSKPYFLGKLFHSGISAFLIWVYFRFFPLSANVFYYEYPYWYGLDPSFSQTFWIANLICTSVFLIFTALLYFSIVFLSKRSYNRKKKRGEISCFTEKE